MDFLKFIIEDAYYMVAVLWIIGEGIKGIEVNSKWILPILILASIGFTPWLLGGYTPENIVQAVLVAGGAVLVDQTRKQVTKNKQEIDHSELDEEFTVNKRGDK